MTLIQIGEKRNPTTVYTAAVEDFVSKAETGFLTDLHWIVMQARNAQQAQAVVT
jgi:hypothetical protein